MKSLKESHSIPRMRVWVSHQACWRSAMSFQCFGTTKLMGFQLKSWRPEGETSFIIYIVIVQCCCHSVRKGGQGRVWELQGHVFPIHNWKDSHSYSRQETSSTICPPYLWYSWYDLHSTTATKKVQGTKPTITHGFHWHDESLWLHELPGTLESPGEAWMSRKLLRVLRLSSWWHVSNRPLPWKRDRGFQRGDWCQTRMHHCPNLIYNFHRSYSPPSRPVFPLESRLTIE